MNEMKTLKDIVRNWFDRRLSNKDIIYKETLDKLEFDLREAAIKLRNTKKISEEVWDNFFNLNSEDLER